MRENVKKGTFLSSLFPGPDAKIFRAERIKMPTKRLDRGFPELCSRFRVMLVFRKTVVAARWPIDAEWKFSAKSYLFKTIISRTLRVKYIDRQKEREQLPERRGKRRPSCRDFHHPEPRAKQKSYATCATEDHWWGPRRLRDPPTQSSVTVMDFDTG